MSYNDDSRRRDEERRRDEDRRRDDQRREDQRREEQRRDEQRRGEERRREEQRREEQRRAEQLRADQLRADQQRQAEDRRREELRQQTQREADATRKHFDQQDERKKAHYDRKDEEKKDFYDKKDANRRQDNLEWQARDARTHEALREEAETARRQGAAEAANDARQRATEADDATQRRRASVASASAVGLPPVVVGPFVGGNAGPAQTVGSRSSARASTRATPATERPTATAKPKGLGFFVWLVILLVMGSTIYGAMVGKEGLLRQYTQLHDKVLGPTPHRWTEKEVRLTLQGRVATPNFYFVFARDLERGGAGVGPNVCLAAYFHKKYADNRVTKAYFPEAYEHSKAYYANAVQNHLACQVTVHADNPNAPLEDLLELKGQTPEMVKAIFVGLD